MPRRLTQQERDEREEQVEMKAFNKAAGYEAVRYVDKVPHGEVHPSVAGSKWSTVWKRMFA